MSYKMLRGEAAVRGMENDMAWARARRCPLSPPVKYCRAGNIFCPKFLTFETIDGVGWIRCCAAAEGDPAFAQAGEEEVARGRDGLLAELNQKVNAWFKERPQRSIAAFMLDTMLPYLDDGMKESVTEIGRTEQALMLLWREYCDETQYLAIDNNRATCIDSIAARFEVMRGYLLRDVVAFVEGRWSRKGRMR